MVALLAGKGLALAAGKPLIAVNHLEGHALSPRLVDPDLGFPYLLLLVSGGHCQLLEVRGVGDYRRLATTIDDAAGEAFDKAAKLLGLRLSRRPGDRGAGEERRSDGRAAAAPAGRLGRAAFLLRRPEERGPARGRVGRATSREDIAASFQQAVVDCLVDRTALALGRERCAGAGRRRRSRGQPGDPHRAGRSRASARAARFSVPPGWLCTDNAAMIAWAGAERFAAGPDRRARRAGARALAARRKRREGARRGGEGMKLGVIGGGAWGTALAQVAAAGGRETLLWALEAEVVEAVNARHENPRLPRRHAAQSGDPRDRRPRRARRLRRLAGGDPGAAHARRCSSSAAGCDKPLVLCSKGIEEQSGELLHEVAQRGLPGSAGRGAVRPDLRA